MKIGSRSAAALCVALAFASLSAAQQPSAAPAPSRSTKEPIMHHATGPFEVKLAPQAEDAHSAGGAIGRMSIDKQFHGELEATSIGQMLASSTAVQGSAGYVAIEKVTGTLHGRSGTFVLQHTGTMTRGVPQLAITVVPDSGTGQLAGLTGRMDIKIAEGGKHSYELEYSLPEAP